MHSLSRQCSNSIAMYWVSFHGTCLDWDNAWNNKNRLNPDTSGIRTISRLDTSFVKVKHRLSGKDIQDGLHEEAKVGWMIPLARLSTTIAPCVENAREGPKPACRRCKSWKANATDEGHQDNDGDSLKRILMCALCAVENQCIFRGFLFRFLCIHPGVWDASPPPRATYNQALPLQEDRHGEERPGNPGEPYGDKDRWHSQVIALFE